MTRLGSCCLVFVSLLAASTAAAEERRPTGARHLDAFEMAASVGYVQPAGELAGLGAGVAIGDELAPGGLGDLAQRARLGVRHGDASPGSCYGWRAARPAGR